MTYRNKKTGAVVTTNCKISGKNWEEVKKADPKKADPKKADPKKGTEKE